MLKRGFLAAAVIATAAAIFIWVELPPKQQRLAATFSDGTVPGILHIHSSRSDGRGTPEQIAHDAARAGLKFIVITDHGDATQRPDPPVYREGVLCLDGTEISTRDGHYIAIDMPASPFPLGGEGRDVVDDVKRLGGFGIVAHPDSPKPELQWKAWTAPFDAVEVVNLDTTWRRRVADPGWRSKAALVRSLLTYFVRPAESIAGLVAPSLPSLPATAVQQWNVIAQKRPLVMLAGADAHAQIAWRASDPIQARLSIPVPRYEALFRAMSVRLRLDRALTGDAKVDATAVFRAVRAGHLYIALDGIATPPAFELTATNATGTVGAGDHLAVGGPVMLQVHSNAPSGFATTIFNGTTPVAVDRREDEFSLSLPAADGVYWAQIHAAGARGSVPWIVSNPVYVRAAESLAPTQTAAPNAANTSTPLFDERTTTGWRIESDSTSLGAVDVASLLTSEKALRLRFGLASGPPASQFVALAVDTPRGAAPNDRISFQARAERPMRISVQLRAGQSRWARSVYVDTVSQPHVIPFADFRGVDESAPGAVPVSDVATVLFVIDTTNTKPGTSGRLWIASPALGR